MCVRKFTVAWRCSRAASACSYRLGGGRGRVLARQRLVLRLEAEQLVDGLLDLGGVGLQGERDEGA